MVVAIIFVVGSSAMHATVLYALTLTAYISATVACSKRMVATTRNALTITRMCLNGLSRALEEARAAGDVEAAKASGKAVSSEGM